MAPTPSDPAVIGACERWAEHQPEVVSGQEPRALGTKSRLVAAWGDPPIVLRCGVPRPSALSPTSALVTVNGVDWFAEELTRGYRFTTVGSEAYLEVTVPEAYAPEVDALVDLASAVPSPDAPRP